MSLSIGSQSIQSSSIFSQHDSYLSANTQWTFENLEKLDEGYERFRSDGEQTKTRQRMGRPEIIWTPATVRKLTRLYLLTDLEVEKIIDVLRTAEFQPSKRHVQEKLKILLQPQPNTIRARGDTKILRKIFLECKNAQKTRRMRKQRHRRRVETKCLEEGHHAIADAIENQREFKSLKETTLSSDDFHYATNVLPAQLDIFDDEESFLGDSSFFSPEDQTQYDLTTGPTPELDLPPTECITADLKDPVPYLDWHLSDFGIQPACAATTAHANHFNETRISNIYEFDGNFPDIGFDVDLRSSPMVPLLRNDKAKGFQMHNNSIVSMHPEQATGPPHHPPTIDPTHIQSNIEPGTELDREVDAVDLSPWEVAPPMLSFERPPQTEFRSFKEPLTEKRNLDNNVTRRRGSKHSQLSSRLSTILSKMSLRSTSLLSDSCQPSASCNELTDTSSVDTSPILLPGVFPKYCWQHITQNELRRCSHWYDPQNCQVKACIKNATTHRPLHEDILCRIVNRTVRASDIHEIDTFGNSILHIATTLLARPNYLLSLVKLGVKVNSTNSAGQTFLHLIEPEALFYCDDFCELLELLRTFRFNFAQHDHLGRSPLHLLMRPSIHSDILRKIITKLFSLSIHSDISTSRDCFGVTVMGQINLQETDELSGVDLDQAILYFACETTKPIIDPKSLRPSSNNGVQITPKDKERFARNYENHPSIITVQDLVQYEQHVDYWRTILATQESPWFEDSHGKNGLHCLAEADLVSSKMPLPGQLLGQLDSFRVAKHKTASTREDYVNLLLSAGVDPNNYDHYGNTVIMAFVTHERAAESEESTTEILNMLFNAGGDINRRNRHGETALHLAVKLGRRAATKALLVAGANVHARTSSGLGVLELGQKCSAECKQSGISYSQILLCMSLAANFGAVSQPSILDEWGSPGMRLPNQARKEQKGLKLVKNFIMKRAQKRIRLKS